MKFAVPGVASAVAGAVLGAIAVFVITAAVQQNTRPDIDRSGDADSSLLNNVEYGSR
ncbi:MULTISPECIES: DUF2613 domain-containing protein [Nocardia]|uniref:DUF2613 domain-containing protein n=2 Tax=Nocardia TaxID=1817 RepID=A0A285LRL2_9NOCA|nr:MULTISPECIES: DUF2613 domain-containing protein [Nocardia]MCP2276476.1 Protein of unknown function (DUF2613) [Nocardia amikacinitolerans]MCP2292319.1 Protein of unknown function (DUF2613) [Nocardia amikacinitolerans]MCP2295143.1 Protein of unknown function (DUF2613) [Nocardia amikacinitolerans]MCP2319423.1 Protein of unknown function (DUF2613) [Nocardia amikacinitolerans]TQM29833.1 uncharacterized protein DUF2613 [Nocardia bhagyanarayanae]